jgi:hypothetical protein
VTFNVTDPSNNVAATVTRTVIVNEASATGIGSVQANGTAVRVYPNPSSGRFTIEAEHATDIQTVKVYDIIGTLVKEVSIKSPAKTIDMDLTGMSEGVYIIRMEGSTGSVTRKINIVK